MRRLCFLLAAVGVFGHSAGAQSTRTKVDLLLSHEVAAAGSEVLAGVRLQMPAPWHTYWRNPGGPGSPTKITWDLPAGIHAGEILWPAPERYTSQDITTYVYRNETILLVPLTLASDAAPGIKDIRAKVDWLECDESCIPGNAKVMARLTVGTTPRLGAASRSLEAARQQLPKDGRTRQAIAVWENAPLKDERSLLIEWRPAPGTRGVDFYPDHYSDFEVSVETTEIPGKGGLAQLRKKVTKFVGDWPRQVGGLLIEKRTDGPPAGFEVSLAIVESAGATTVAATTSPPAAAQGTATEFAGPGLGRMLWFGFLGGLILNIMPCVFPVIALKILGFVSQAKEAPGDVLRLGLLYTAGVVASFMVMAGMVILVRSGGGAASWGMQMQNPQFTVILTSLVTLVALNLFGVFEVNLGGTAMGAAGHLASKEGPAGAFFNGVLATVLATPCTAPFLAPALGFAFAQPSVVIVAMFLSVALGLALPYVVLSAKPDWLRFLPRPGAWMERFKVAMGFPMLATAIWLFSFTARRFGPDGPLYLGLFLVMLSLAAWVWGEFAQRAAQRRGLAMGLALAIAFSGYAYALEGELNWRAPVKRQAASGVVQHGANGIVWLPWSADAVSRAITDGHPVLVDFTADWCLTCQANKRTSLEIESVRSKLKSIDAVSLIGDYTEEDPHITQELKRFQRAGVPLVLVYSRHAGAPPKVLPALLTPDTVIEALDWAAR